MIDLLILIKNFKKFKTTSSTGGLHMLKRVGCRHPRQRASKLGNASISGSRYARLPFSLIYFYTRKRIQSRTFIVRLHKNTDNR